MAISYGKYELSFKKNYENFPNCGLIEPFRMNLL